VSDLDRTLLLEHVSHEDGLAAIKDDVIDGTRIQGMEIGIDSFAALLPNLKSNRPALAGDRMAELLTEIEIADRVGLDVFGIGEHHREEYLDAAPAVILAAAAARTRKIRLTSAVTVLSADDPVRVFQQFATLDLISGGRAEVVVGRGSSTEAYPLFGWDMRDYDALFAEKLYLLLRLRDETHVSWKGRFRPALTGQGVFPRPLQDKLPVWIGVGGTPESFVRAGTLGLPLMIAIIGGSFPRFRPLVAISIARRVAGLVTPQGHSKSVSMLSALSPRRHSPRATCSFRAGSICLERSAVNVAGPHRPASSLTRLARQRVLTLSATPIPLSNAC
jgi:hypothetical protein